MKDTIALITGGTRGIGFGCATALAHEGCRLALNGVRPEEQAAPALDTLRAVGVDVVYCQGDIGQRADRTAILEKVCRDLGSPNFLVNNAGVAPRERKDILEADEDNFDYVLQTNLKGAYFLTQATARLMIKEKDKNTDFPASIVNIGSISATIASVNRGEYCVAKAGLAMMSQLFAARLGEFGIPVFEVRPGVTRTDMTAGVKDKYDQLIANGLTVTPRWGEPEDVGKAVAALLRGDFPYSTGAIIPVDGGLTLPRL